jgi:CubicO group peptidase (beta-lactamase class C family)
MQILPAVPLGNGAAKFSKSGLDHLVSTLQAEITAGVIPGAVVLIGSRGAKLWSAHLGVLDPVSQSPMRPDAVFRIYSMTKPITSLAAMMLVEEGRLSLDDALSTYVPAFNAVKVGRYRGTTLELAEPSRPIRIHDLLRHTSGLSHETMVTPHQEIYASRDLARRDRTVGDHVLSMAELPLLCDPGSEWNYSRSVEVLGYVLEVVTGVSLGEFLRDRLFGPLEMVDTAFHADPERVEGRIAQPFATDPWSGKPISLFDVTDRPRFEAGGGGLVSTAPDYARFATLLLNEGELGGRRYVGSRTLRYMTADHLGPGVSHRPDPLPAGYGFGLGFAVRMHPGLAPFPGAIGQYFWNGVAGTQFWVDPVEGFWALLMVQAPGQRNHLRSLIRHLVYAAISD